MDDDRKIQGQEPDSTTPTRRAPVRSLAFFPGIRFDPNDGDGGGAGDDQGDGDGGNGDGGAGAGDGGSTEAKTYDEAYVKQLRDEAAKRRVRERELEDRLKELEQKDLSEKERAERERDEARKQADDAIKLARTASLKAEVTAAALKHDAVDADAVLALVSGGIAFGDDGAPQGVDEAVKALLDSKPFLKKPAGGAGASAGNGSSDRGRNRLTLESLKAMTPEQIQALDQAEVNRVLAGG